MGFIYQIRNTKNGKCYVGQTKRDQVSQRWREHTRHPGGVLKHAFALYGMDVFEFSVICEIPNEELSDREIKEIHERNTLAPNGYNLQKGGDVNTHHEDTKRKISELNKISHKGVKLSAEHARRISEGQRASRNMSHPRDEETRQNDREAKRSTMKPVDQYTLDGVFVKTWESVRATKVNGVRQCCSLTSKTAKGFVWRWHGEAFDTKPSEEQVRFERAKTDAKRAKVNSQRRERRLKLRAPCDVNS